MKKIIDNDLPKDNYIILKRKGKGSDTVTRIVNPAVAKDMRKAKVWNPTKKKYTKGLK